MSAWAERCPCHEALQKEYARRRMSIPIALLRREMGKYAEQHDGLICPARTCRAPELAAGEMTIYLESCFASSRRTCQG